MKILSGGLILLTAFLSFKHGWDGLHLDAHPEQAKMMESLSIGTDLPGHPFKKYYRKTTMAHC